jgi:uridine kinase
MKLLGISGKSGSGKTTLINGIRDKFSPEDVSFISLDNYYRPREEQKKDELGYYNFDLVDSFDWPQVEQDLDQLLSGKKVTKKKYVFNNEENGGFLTFTPARLLVVEGIFIFNNKMIWDRLDYSILIEAPDELCRARRLSRDLSERNYRQEEILHRFNNHFLPAYRQIVEPLKPKVNLILYNEEELEIARKIILGTVTSVLKDENK